MTREYCTFTGEELKKSLILRLGPRLVGVSFPFPFLAPLVLSLAFRPPRAPLGVLPLELEL